MSDTTETCKYKWTPESTKLLVSVWTDKQVQKQLEYSVKPQLIWESVAKYMNKKGYNVTGKQCRSRMKQLLVCYQEKKREGTYDSLEQHFDSIEKVIKIKKLVNQNHQGIDTVDYVKYPVKDVKTNKNFQIRYKNQKPVESIHRTDALSPMWSGMRDEDSYPESPESHETVLAQPYRVFSPVRDAATNTTAQNVGHLNKKVFQQNLNTVEEIPIKENFRHNPTNFYNEIPFQNAVQNVQNQIIQENMQQNQALLQQNLLQNQMLNRNRLNTNQNFNSNFQNINQALYNDQILSNIQGQITLAPNIVTENILRAQNKLQQNAVNNKAMPQEPLKNNFRQNLAQNYAQFQDIRAQNFNGNINQMGIFSPSISPDIPTNLNDAFFQTKGEQVLNETFRQTNSNGFNADATAITNNATFNDDTISIDFLHDSPSPENEPTKLKDFAVNTNEVPHVPVRKKKAQKLEQLMFNAISSQSEVVEKILAAQNDMVSRVLDLDRDRQSRLENRLDHLLDVVQANVLNKSSEKNSEVSEPISAPTITCLSPPPMPGSIPPKLDLVPPKPCRVACTNANTNFQLKNQNPAVMTRPGVVSPAASPTKRVGTIWSKLGPVSTSPFVKAQQQLGFRPIQNNDMRTQSSAERRIARDAEFMMDFKMLKDETTNFINAEKQIQEAVENACINSKLGQDLTARKRLFSKKEPTAAMVLTSAFLEAECQSTEADENARLKFLHENRNKNIFNDRYKLKNFTDQNKNDDLLAGQGDSYNHLRNLNIQSKIIDKPCDSSTPAKIPPPKPSHVYENPDEPRRTVQQLAHLVMNSARWRNPAVSSNQEQFKNSNQRLGIGKTRTLNAGNKNEVIFRKPKGIDQVDANLKTLNWLQDRYSYPGMSSNNFDFKRGDPQFSVNNEYSQQTSNKRSVGFKTEYLNNENERNNFNIEKEIGFIYGNECLRNGEPKSLEDKDPLEELCNLYVERQNQLRHQKNVPYMTSNGQMVMAHNGLMDLYMRENRLSRATDSDNDEEFLDTTSTWPPSNSHKNSQSSLATKSSKLGSVPSCVIS